MLQGCWSFDISCYQREQGGEQGHKANVLTRSYHSLLTIHAFSIFGISKCTSGSEMPAFYLFLKELKQIAALTDPYSFSQATTIQNLYSFFFIKYSKNGLF